MDVIKLYTCLDPSFYQIINPVMVFESPGHSHKTQGKYNLDLEFELFSVSEQYKNSGFTGLSSHARDHFHKYSTEPECAQEHSFVPMRFGYNRIYTFDDSFKQQGIYVAYSTLPELNDISATMEATVCNLFSIDIQSQSKCHFITKYLSTKGPIIKVSYILHSIYACGNLEPS